MNTNQPISFIRELCKHKSEAEIFQAEGRFREYLLLVKRICERKAQEQSLQDIDQLKE